MKTLRCGFSRRIITPTEEERKSIVQDGYGFRVRPCDGVRDDLYVQVCSFSEGERVFLLFSFDLCGMNPKLYKTMSACLSSMTGIPVSSMALSCTHTHSGPTGGVLAINPIDWDYFYRVSLVAAEAAQEAMKRAVPGHFDCGFTGEFLSCGNRRDGREVRDPRILTAIFSDESGRVRGGIACGACHAVINTSLKISADYLSYLHEMASDEMPILYLEGRGADIDPTDKTEDVMRRLGQELCSAVKKGIRQRTNASPEKASFVRTYKRVDIPVLPTPGKKEIAALRKQYLEQFADIHELGMARHYTTNELNYLYCMEQYAGRRKLTVPVQFFSPSRGLLFVFLPFELLTLTGNKIEEIARRKGYDANGIFVAGYTNSVHSYLPPAEEFAYGGYEVDVASHWYGFPDYSPDSEGALLAWVEKNLPER